MTRLVLALLSAAPLALAGVGALLPSAPPVTLKGDRVAELPSAKTVQTIQFLSGSQEMVEPPPPPPLPQARPYQAAPPVAEPARKVRRSAGLCARHGLRKAWVSSTRWRCRR